MDRGRRCLLLQEPELRINVQAPVGDVCVQISDVAGKPLEGLAFENRVPFTGASLYWESQWKSGKSLRDALGRAVRVDVRMYRASLYAIRGGFEVLDLVTRWGLQKAGRA